MTTQGNQTRRNRNPYAYREVSAGGWAQSTSGFGGFGGFRSFVDGRGVGGVGGIRDVGDVGPDDRWWVVPAVCTAVLVLSAWLDLSVLAGTGMSGPATMAFGYAVPAVLVTVSWLLPHRRSLRSARIGLGVTAAAAVVLFSKIAALGLMLLLMFFVLLCGGTLEG
ncbi:hypothetical protein [Streptomyces sp. MBT27]|uniref:hypothetical protein n=1 Tax=Streptomyces sp. MBT27 TaxID=1488356 RepID=UPI00142332B7|nr:hypothetical protein [Streptomyces sp. MBT27]